MSSAETSKPVESEAERQVQPVVVEAGPLAVQVHAEEKPVSQDVPKNEFVGIADLIKDIPDSKVEMAEGLGIPIRGILRWAYIMEENVKAQGRALTTLGVNLQPVVELAQKVKAQQTTSQANPRGGGIGDLMQLAREAGLIGGQTGMSEGDRYFMEMGRESASLGNFVAKELFKKMMPEAIAKFETERAAAAAK